MPQVHRLRRYAADMLCFVLGSGLFALSVNMFTAPNAIAPGGVTGAAILIGALWHTPIGITSMLLNIPLFVWGYKALGWRGIAKSLAAVVISAVLIDVTAAFVPPYQGDAMLAAVFGGVLAGSGLALIFMRGGTTGGTDLAAALLSRYVRHIPLGRLLLLIDLPVVLLSGVVFANIESPLYALIVIFLTGKLIDSILYGVSQGNGKTLLIISPQHMQIEQALLHHLSRGVTALCGRGGYARCNMQVLLCAVRRAEVYRAYDLIYHIDPTAFVIVITADEICGQGFLSRHNNA